MGGQRLDVALVARGLAESRAKARAAIEGGLVSVDGRQASKASEVVSEAALIEARPAHPWVGRGALKLVHALDLWGVDPKGRVAVDVGASTGGFTEVCLSRGAARVYALDVGRDQLHPSLRADPRVINLEGVDARAASRALIPESFDLVVCDVSFIGLAKALPAVMALAAEGSDLVALVKPQFEVGRAHVGKGGLVRDEAERQRALVEAEAFMEASGWSVRAASDSPIEGGEGAREYLLWAKKRAAR